MNCVLFSEHFVVDMGDAMWMYRMHQCKRKGNESGLIPLKYLYLVENINILQPIFPIKFVEAISVIACDGSQLIFTYTNDTTVLDE
jgi:hypothetical protein